MDVPIDKVEADIYFYRLEKATYFMRMYGASETTIGDRLSNQTPERRTELLRRVNERFKQMSEASGVDTENIPPYQG